MLHADEPPLIFVYLGDAAPPYMKAALRLAVRHAKIPVRLVAPASFSSSVPPGCEHVHLESFYDDTSANQLLRGLDPLSLRHINLWVRSTERFTVLQSYVGHVGLESFFHAELDCLTFRLDALGEALRATGRTGLFIPLDGPDRAIASLVFVNDPAALRAFIAWASNQQYRTEMELLARFARSHPESVIGLPTLEVLQAPERFTDAGLSVLAPQSTGSLVDAASLGQWIGGIDPMNLPRRSLHRNHFVNECLPDPQMLRLSRTEWDPASFPVFVSPHGVPFRVHAVHLHSKLHRRLLRPRSLERLLERSNGTRARLLPGVPARLVSVLVSNASAAARRVIRRVDRRGAVR